MTGLINKDKEALCLQKGIDQLKMELNRLEGKLNTLQFVKKAPVDVVAKEETRLSQTKESIAKLEKQLSVL